GRGRPASDRKFRVEEVNRRGTAECRTWPSRIPRPFSRPTRPGLPKTAARRSGRARERRVRRCAGTRGAFARRKACVVSREAGAYGASEPIVSRRQGISKVKTEARRRLGGATHAFQPGFCLGNRVFGQEKNPVSKAETGLRSRELGDRLRSVRQQILRPSGRIEVLLFGVDAQGVEDRGHQV